MVLVRHHHSFLHAIQASQRHLDLDQIDAMTADFNSGVFSS